MAKNPSFQFYANDFLADVAEWTNEEVGIYMRLLCLQWINGSISAELDRLPYNAKSVWGMIGGKFELGKDNRYRNKKLETIRAQKMTFLEKQKANGTKGGRPKNNPTITQPFVKTKPNQNLIEEEVEIEEEVTEEVENCYNDCLKFFPEHLHPKKPETWLETIDKLHRIDGVPYDQIVLITKLTRANDFWSKNFMSLTKLRKKNREEIAYIVVFNEQLNKNGTTGSSLADKASEFAG